MLPNRVERDKLTSMLHWYPKAKDLAPTPRTVFVETPTTRMGLYLDDGPDLPVDFTKKLYAAADAIGYPLFMRTDLTSGKFEWKTTCYVPAKKSLLTNMYRLLEYTEMVSLIGLPTRAIVFRELLKLDTGFTAFMGMPVAKERRYFVRDGKLVCHHPYWPTQAILKWALSQARCGIKTELPSNWQEILQAKNAEDPAEVAQLTELSEKVGKALGGFWSIDFAYVPAEAKWYLIDAAMGIDSFHPSTCPHCPKEVKAEMAAEEQE